MTTLEVIGIVTGAVATVIGGIYFIFAKVFKLGKERQHLEEFESKVTEKFDSLEKSFDSLQKSLPCTSHHDDLLRIKGFLNNKYPSSAVVFSAKASPRRLNDLGRKLFDDIQGEQFLATNKEELFRLIDETKPQVALDVEQAALSACSAIATTPAFNGIKDYIYNAPSIELPDNGGKYDIAIPDVCFVLSLRLRDMYLEEKKQN